jgi:hypothetical protein
LGLQILQKLPPYFSDLFYGPGSTYSQQSGDSCQGISSFTSSHVVAVPPLTLRHT